jgi:heterodisulfide reductase subunit C
VNPRKNLRLLVQELLAAKDRLPAAAGDLLWLCTTCYQCEDRCPEGIPLATLLIKVKNMAADQGLVPEAIRQEIEALLATGFTFPPVKGILARRKKLGLPDLPLPDDHEMQALFDRIDARPKSSQPKGGSV